jgi:hypothetical protein
MSLCSPVLLSGRARKWGLTPRSSFLENCTVVRGQFGPPRPEPHAAVFDRLQEEESSLGDCNGLGTFAVCICECEVDDFVVPDPPPFLDPSWMLGFSLGVKRYGRMSEAKEALHAISRPSRPPRETTPGALLES